jgi:hypothetical protein
MELTTMQSIKLRMAIRATAAVAILSVAGQAQAFNFSAGDVDASVYGYVRLNMSYDIDENVADDSQSGSFPTIAGDDADGHFGASASQSRFGIKATNANGVMINVEGDFFGGDFRLRQAYGTYNGVLAGQTWSNYSSFVGSTSTLDFSGPAGNAGYQLRSAQLRYTTGPLSFSIEDPKSRGLANRKEGLPALTARLEDKTGNLSYSAAALVKQNSYDDPITGDDDSAMAYAVFGAAKLAISDMISIQGGLNYSDGANAYLYRSGGDDAYRDGNDVENISGLGAKIGTSISLGDGRSVNLVYGMTTLDVDDLGPNANETNDSALINYMWTPVKDVMMGVEFARFSSENQAGDSDSANRVMFAAQYNF